MSQCVSACRVPEGGHRRRWGNGLAEAMMGMLQDSGGRFGVAAPHLVGHFGAMREAFAGGFSTAHWHTSACESLLPGGCRLPSTVAACMPGHTQHSCTHQSKDWLPAHVMSGIAAQCDICPYKVFKVDPDGC